MHLVKTYENLINLISNNEVDIKSVIEEHEEKKNSLLDREMECGYCRINFK